MARYSLWRTGRVAFSCLPIPTSVRSLPSAHGPSRRSSCSDVAPDDVLTLNSPAFLIENLGELASDLEAGSVVVMGGGEDPDQITAGRRIGGVLPSPRGLHRRGFRAPDELPALSGVQGRRRRGRQPCARHQAGLRAHLPAGLLRAALRVGAVRRLRVALREVPPIGGTSEHPLPRTPTARDCRHSSLVHASTASPRSSPARATGRVERSFDLVDLKQYCTNVRVGGRLDELGR